MNRKERRARREPGDVLNEPSFRRFAEKWMRETAPLIRQSAYSIVVAPGESSLRDVKLAIEIGYSIMMDKPLIVMVPKGRRHHAPKLMRIADKVIEADLSDPEDSARAQAELKAYLMQ